MFGSRLLVDFHQVFLLFVKPCSSLRIEVRRKYRFPVISRGCADLKRTRTHFSYCPEWEVLKESTRACTYDYLVGSTSQKCLRSNSYCTYINVDSSQETQDDSLHVMNLPLSSSALYPRIVLVGGLCANVTTRRARVTTVHCVNPAVRIYTAYQEGHVMYLIWIWRAAIIASWKVVGKLTPWDTYLIGV